MSPISAHNNNNNHQRLSQTPVAGSLQNLAHQNSAFKHRPLSPPPNFNYQHQHHNHNIHLHHQLQQQQVYNQTALPVRSLSMSGQMLTPSHLSLMVSPTSTPPTTSATTPISSSPASFVTGPPGQLRVSLNSQSPITRPVNINENSHSPGKQSSRAGATNCSSDFSTSRLMSPIANQLSPSVPIPNQTNKQSAALTQGSPTDDDSTNRDTTSPMMRQHSLVSRYNCKPCGIVFSQPETLRAHQEGYCTKTNRNQVRSQSAVSPSAIKQSVTVNNNNNTNTSNK